MIMRRKRKETSAYYLACFKSVEIFHFIFGATRCERGREVGVEVGDYLVRSDMYVDWVKLESDESESAESSGLSQMSLVR